MPTRLVTYGISKVMARRRSLATHDLALCNECLVRVDGCACWERQRRPTDSFYTRPSGVLAVECASPAAQRRLTRWLRCVSGSIFQRGRPGSIQAECLPESSGGSCDWLLGIGVRAPCWAASRPGRPGPAAPGLPSPVVGLPCCRPRHRSTAQGRKSSDSPHCRVAGIAATPECAVREGLEAMLRRRRVPVIVFLFHFLLSDSIPGGCLHRASKRCSHLRVFEVSLHTSGPP